MVTLVVLAGLIVGGWLVKRLLTPGPKTLRDFEVLPGGGDAKVGCKHPAGDCKSESLKYTWFDRIEVTRRQWQRCADAKACVTLPAAAEDDDDLPVTGVTLPDARAYCRWRNGDLPTDQQWEALARAFDLRRYPWGDEPPTCERANIASCGGKPLAATRPAGASVNGLEDLAGNVAEYVLERSFERETKPPWRARGGSFLDDAGGVTGLAARQLDAPARDVGFRCAYQRSEISEYGRKDRDGDVPQADDKAEQLVDQRFIDAKRVPRTPWGTASIKATNSGKHDFAGDATTLLTSRGARVVASGGDATIEIRCTEEPFGSFTYSYGGYSNPYGRGTPGTKFTCAVAVAGARERVEITVEGSTSTGTKGIYESAIDDVLDSAGWKAIPLLVALVAGNDDALPDLVELTSAAYEHEAVRGELAKLLLSRRAKLPRPLQAQLLIAAGELAEAVQLGEDARDAFDAWVTKHSGHIGTKELETARSLAAGGPVGQRALAAWMARLGKTKSYGVSDADIMKWLELVGATGTVPELRAAAALWSDDINPKLAAAAQAAMAAFDQRNGTR
ncbi:MAG: SUMF1/EgtB/PvdO family nonheme iron enzyme [Myxococcales bacterium]|nr:SUMF1/EgtB/PvdO family nonheme iron enzyme [Myxococcales bacterium]